MQTQRGVCRKPVRSFDCRLPNFLGSRRTPGMMPTFLPQLCGMSALEQTHVKPHTTLPPHAHNHADMQAQTRAHMSALIITSTHMQTHTLRHRQPRRSTPLLIQHMKPWGMGQQYRPHTGVNPLNLAHTLRHRGHPTQPSMHTGLVGVNPPHHWHSMVGVDPLTKYGWWGPFYGSVLS
jgi:hypothetical protein